MESYRDILLKELEIKQAKNPHYSLRSFASFLQVSPSKISEVISGKQGLSKAKALEIGEKLNFSREKLKLFTNLVEVEHSKSEEKKKKALREVQSYKRLMERRSLKKSEENVANWLAFAIRRLTQVKDFNSDHDWIAERLGVTKEEVDLTINKMLQNKNLGVTSEGNYFIDDNILGGFFPESFESHYKKVLDRANYARLNLKGELQHAGFHVFAIRHEQVAKLRKFIQELEDKIDEETYEFSDPEGVYCFMSHLFPLVEDENTFGPTREKKS